jgi:hypothetical protein
MPHVVRRTDIEHAAMLYGKFFSTREIAELTGWSRGKVLRLLRLGGVTMRGPGPVKR